MRRHHTAVLTGGEPTMYRNVPTICGFLRKVGFQRLELQTNGRKFSELQFAGELASCGTSHAFVSLYGHCPSVHEEITRVDGSFRQTLLGIHNAVEAGIRTQVNFVVSRETLPHVEAFARWAVQQFPNFSIRFSLCCRKGRAVANGSTVTFQECMPTLRDAISTALDGGLELTTQYIPLCLLGPLYWLAIEAQGPSRPVLLCDVSQNYTVVWSGSMRNYDDECQCCAARHICPGIGYGHRRDEQNALELRPFRASPAA